MEDGCSQLICMLLNATDFTETNVMQVFIQLLTMVSK